LSAGVATPQIEGHVILTQSALPISRTGDVSELLQRAEALRSSRRLEEAESIYRRAIAESPGIAFAHSELGLCLSWQGRHREAIAELRRALAIDPGLAYAHANVGVSLMGCGRWRGALIPLRRAVSLQPNNWFYRGELGRALYECCDFQAAIEQYRYCLERCPGDTVSRYGLGLALIKAGDIEDALVQFERCVHDDPGDFLAFERVGVCLLALDRPWLAVAPLRRSLALNSARAGTWSALACAWGLDGQLEWSMAALVRAVCLEPASIHHFWDTGFLFLNRFWRMGRAGDLAGAAIVWGLALGLGRVPRLADVLLRRLRALVPDAVCEEVIADGGRESRVALQQEVPAEGAVCDDPIVSLAVDVKEIVKESGTEGNSGAGI
jgi:tetratricopeptide (TPR) repeat protein